MKIQKISTLFVFTLSLLIFSIAQASNLPNLGDESQSVLTPQKERTLGHYFMRAIRKHLLLVQDPIISDYIKNLGFQLVAASPKPSHPFHFFVVNDTTINAFSGPDGYIGVNSGLILTTETESELAAVLAHEIAHTVQGHIARFYADQQRLQLPVLGATLAAIAIGTINPEAGMGTLAATTAGAYQHALNFSRGNEREADRVGIQILAKANFDPRAMPQFFERLQKDSFLNGDNVPQLLRTHPVTAERLVDAYNRSTQYPVKAVKNGKTFALIQGRLVAQFNTNIPALIRLLKTKLNNKSDFLKIGYAYTLALMKDKQYSKANKQLNKLLKKEPDNIILKITQSQLLQKKDDQSTALKIMKKLYQYNPDYYPVIYYYAKLLMHNKHNKQAAIILRASYHSEKNNVHYLRLFSRALGHSKQLPQAYEVRSRIYLLIGDKSGAIEQLKMALHYAKNDEQTKNRIQYKLKQLQKKKKTK